MKPTPSSRPTESAAPAPGGPLCVRGRVLVADGSADARAALAKVFSAEGFSAVECGYGSDVVPLAKLHQPDVVFLDVDLRRADAGECVRILERFGGTRSVVVVLTCPRDIDATRLARLEATGALLVLVKPLTRDGVLQAFRQALAESHRRKQKFEAPARRRPATTRHVAGNNALLVRRLECPFHETPVAVDRFMLRTGKIQTDLSFFDLPVYKKPVGGADYVDYHLLGVAVCPRCLFASNNPACFADRADRKGRAPEHTAVTRAAIAGATGARLILAGELPDRFFTHERSLAGAILSYDLAIHSAKTLLASNRHGLPVENLRVGNYYLRLAYLHGLAGSGDDARREHFEAAFAALHFAFMVLDGPELHKSIYQLVALAIAFGDDRRAYQYLTRLVELEREPTKPREDRGSLDRYLARCRRAWEDRDDHRFPWAETAPASDDVAAAA